MAAYLTWGLFPFYFNSLAAVPSFEVLAHRIAWSAGLMLVLVLASRKAGDFVQVFLDRRRLLGLIASAFFISVNWVCFIWAVGHGHALEASLGYFIYPLSNVLLGALLLHERMSRRQVAALCLVAAGVLVLGASMGRVPWLVLAFPVTFSAYALLRKVVAVDAMVGLAVETLLLAPLALVYLLTRADGGAMGMAGAGTVALLVAAGPVTAGPLLLFAYGARRLRLSTLGLLQYLNPTIQMAIAVLAFGEAFGRTHAITFACIWSGILLYSWPARAKA